MRLRRFLVVAGLAVVIAAVGFQEQVARAVPPAQASQPVAYSQQCSQSKPGTVQVVFLWSPSQQGQQWLDLSLHNNGFAPGTFVGVGPLPHDRWAFVWDGLLPGLTHYIRVNTLTANGWAPRPTAAFVTGECSAPVATLGAPAQEWSSLHSGRVKVTFNWTPAAASGITQWLDLSIFNNGFAPGTFIGAGPFAGGAGSFVWDDLVPGTTHYWRVNTLTGSGWHPSATGSFTTLGGAPGGGDPNRATIGHVAQSCSATNPGTVDVIFNWTPSLRDNSGQWLDLSFHSTFPAGQFLGWGPLPPTAGSLTWRSLVPNAVHHWRVNTLRNGAWWTSLPGTFTTIPCGQGSGAAPPAGMRMVIPRIGVNAPVNVRVVGPDGVMGDPNGRFDVIWYDFGNFRGLGGFPGVPGANALFSGHVDYHPHYTAVFWDLRQLVPGDIIDVYLLDGSLVRYSVQWVKWIDPGANFSGHAVQTGEDVITIVTCVGTFSSQTRQYSNRLVVRGIRI